MPACVVTGGIPSGDVMKAVEDNSGGHLTVSMDMNIKSSVDAIYMYMQSVYSHQAIHRSFNNDTFHGTDICFPAIN